MRIRTITMPDDDTGELIIPNPDAGYAGEGNATLLAIAVPAAYAAYSKYLEFQPTGAVVPPYGPLGDGLSEFEFSLPSTVTKNGRLKIQLVIKSGLTVIKSAEGVLYVKKSIGATEGFVAEENDIVQEMIERVAEAEARAAAAIAAAQQAVADILAMRGTDLATLTGGKLTPAQIPALSINDVFEVEDIDAMLALEAERGDCALIIAGGVVSDSYILAADDPTDSNNWKKLGVSYVANAGHANTANNAENADMINNHRLVTMTQAQYDVAATVDTTIYVTYPGE